MGQTTFAEIEKKIIQYEAEIRSAQDKASKVKNNRTAGAVVFLLGLLLTIFFLPAWPLGAFLILIGFLTWITAVLKTKESKEAVEFYYAEIASLRAERNEYQQSILANAIKSASAPPVGSSVPSSLLPPQTPAPLPEPAMSNKLIELKNLLDKQLITEEEYTSKRKQLIDQM
jgi:hypothetical protein